MSGNHHVADMGIQGDEIRGYIVKGRCSCGKLLMEISMNRPKARRKYNRAKRKHERTG